ncbi:MAG: tyrosine-protein phosphatase [Planctomycetota bacterium]
MILNKSLIIFLLCSLIGLGVICCLSPHVKEMPNLAKRIEIPGVANAAEVSKNLYRGAAPNDKGVESMKKLGIKAIIDLRTTSEYKEKAEALEIRYFSMPFHQWENPSEEMVRKYFSIISDPENQPVFIHCREGKDRTGTMIALYRIQYENWSNEDALNEAFFFGLHKIYSNLKKFILEYKPSKE